MAKKWRVVEFGYYTHLASAIDAGGPAASPRRATVTPSLARRDIRARSQKFATYPVRQVVCEVGFFVAKRRIPSSYDVLRLAGV